MSQRADTERFVQSLTGCQERLFAYILSLIPDPNQARDVLQETNLAIWRSLEQGGEIENFLAWACRIAYFQVLTQRRKRQRDRHLFDEDMLQLIAQEWSADGDDMDEQRRALHHCLNQLAADQRELVRRRYIGQGTVKELAAQRGQTVAAVASALHRTRRTLFNCVQRVLAAGER